jgi:hypothetical protein
MNVDVGSCYVKTISKANISFPYLYRSFAVSTTIHVVIAKCLVRQVSFVGSYIKS